MATVSTTEAPQISASQPIAAALRRLEKKNQTAASGELLHYDPDAHVTAPLVLIVDGREDRPGGGRGKSISEHLTKRGILHELRPLAVGDYLWIVKLDGTDSGANAEREMLMDYVIERKTWVSALDFEMCIG